MNDEPEQLSIGELAMLILNRLVNQKQIAESDSADDDGRKSDNREEHDDKCSNFAMV